jgi:aspartate/methionine/tyrosine aminotransferase
LYTQLIQAGVAELRGIMAKHDDLFAYVEPTAGTMTFPKMRKPIATATAASTGEAAGGATAYCEALVKAEGIMLLPSSCYNYGDERFRIGFGRKNAVHAMKLWDSTLTSAQ